MCLDCLSFFVAMLSDLEEQLDAIPLPRPTEGATKPGRSASLCIKYLDNKCLMCQSSLVLIHVIGNTYLSP